MRRNRSLANRISSNNAQKEIGEDEIELDETTALLRGATDREPTEQHHATRKKTETRKQQANRTELPI